MDNVETVVRRRGAGGRRRLGIGIGLITAVAMLAAVPAISSGDLGELVGKDTARKGKSLVAVATATVQNPGKLSLVISTKPPNKKVSWGYTTDCTKDGETFGYPPPGQYEDTISRSKIRERMNKVVDSPDVCRVAVSGKLEYENGQKITAKIFNK